MSYVMQKRLVLSVRYTKVRTCCSSAAFPIAESLLPVWKCSGHGTCNGLALCAFVVTMRLSCCVDAPTVA